MGCCGQLKLQQEKKGCRSALQMPRFWCSKQSQQTQCEPGFAKPVCQTAGNGTPELGILKCIVTGFPIVVVDTDPISSESELSVCFDEQLRIVTGFPDEQPR